MHRPPRDPDPAKHWLAFLRTNLPSSPGGPSDADFIDDFEPPAASHAVLCVDAETRDFRDTFHSYPASSRMATARVQPADAARIFTGKHTIVNPSDGSFSRS